MRELNQWIVWRLEPRPGASKPAKVPFSVHTGRPTDPLDPAGWMSHAEALATGHKIGFVFTEADPYFFLDIDACLVNGAWTDYAVALTHRFPGAMVETSHTGDGLHVVGKYTGPRPEHGTRCREIHSELYTADRFMAIGSLAAGDAGTDHTAALGVLAAQYFPAVERLAAGDWTDGPREDWTGLADDDALIRKARSSGGTAARFGATATFDDLWTANESALETAYPDPRRAWDGSAVDAALARHLAFWTGNDCERIVRLMRESALVRDKWDRDDYMRATVSFAVKNTAKVYDHVRSAAPAIDGEDTRAGYQFLTIEGQIELFTGCIYVTSRNRVMTSRGMLLSQAQFNAVIPSYEFARDRDGKGTTRKPWEAFTESIGYNCPIADEICFDPTVAWDKPIDRDGMSYANTYRPIKTPRKAGDAAPFLEHVSKLLPDELDQAIILAYMAAVVQHKGVKFQWCPIIQGVEGNGKTLLTSVLMAAIGDRHCHTPLSHDLASKFNSWLQGKILIGIEDIYTGGGRREIIEVLKPMITNGNGLGIQAKGADQETARVCCNFMINSNHRDAISKTKNDRRFAVFYTAQQEFEDLARDGMAGFYFPTLYSWLRAGGYAIVHEHLATYDIPDELNPAIGCLRAPRTSTYDEAIEEGLGPLAEEIQERIDDERPGFCGGWISRSLLSTDLKRDHRTVRPSVLKRTLESMGYIRHPALDGRTANVVQPDGRKADLYVLHTHPAAQFTKPGAAAAAYEKAQRCEPETMVFKNV